MKRLQQAFRRAQPAQTAQAVGKTPQVLSAEDLKKVAGGLPAVGGLKGTETSLPAVGGLRETSTKGG